MSTGRFSNLEFGESAPTGASRAPGGEVRDELYFLSQASDGWLSGDFEAALRDYSRALSLNSTLFEGWLGQVRMLIELEEYNEALLWADRALEMYPEHPDLLAAKAVALVRDVRMSDAMSCSDRALGASDSSVSGDVWLARAEVLLARNERLAESCLNNALTLAGNDLCRVRLEAGRMLLRYERPGAAMKLLKDVVEDLPGAALAWYALGCCSAELGLDDARAQFAQAVRLCPGMKAAEDALREFEHRGPWARIKGMFRRRSGE